MAAAALVSENFKFVSLFFKSKDVMIFNGLIALGTVASQTMYNVFAFSCPCSPGRNHRYGMAAIGVPALTFFLLGVMLNHGSWDLLSECRLRRCRKMAAVSMCTVMGNIVGRAAVAPVTWVVISLLQGEAYQCALSEFVNPATLEGLPPQGSHVLHLMAKFPCRGAVPREVLPFLEEIQRRLQYESQMLGWLLVACMAVGVLLMMCVKCCCSPFGSKQEEYWRQFRISEQDLFQRTSAEHAKRCTKANVKRFFGFVALDAEEEEREEEKKKERAEEKKKERAEEEKKKEQTEEEKKKEQTEEQMVCSTHIKTEDWDRVTGVCLYRENLKMPLYSRLHKWARYHLDNQSKGMDKEMTLLDGHGHG